MKQIKISDMWNDYVSRTLQGVPKNSIQYTESEKVFYAAVGQTLLVLRDVVGDVNISEQEGQDIIMDLFQQSLDFWESILKNDTLGV